MHVIFSHGRTINLSLGSSQRTLGDFFSVSVYPSLKELDHPGKKKRFTKVISLCKKKSAGKDSYVAVLPIDAAVNTLVRFFYNNLNYFLLFLFFSYFFDKNIFIFFDFFIILRQVHFVLVCTSLTKL